MIYRCTFIEIDGVRYLTECRLVSETGIATADDELPGIPGPLLTEDGRARFRLVDNPEFGCSADEPRFRIEDSPQPMREKPAAPPPDDRALIMAALPDILLAVAGGADLRGELQKISETTEARGG